MIIIEGPAVPTERPEGFPDVMVSIEKGDGSTMSALNYGLLFYRDINGTAIPTVPLMSFKFEGVAENPEEFIDHASKGVNFDGSRGSYSSPGNSPLLDFVELEGLEEEVVAVLFSRVFENKPGRVLNMVKKVAEYGVGILLGVPLGFYLVLRGKLDGRLPEIFPDHEDGE